MIVGLGQLAVDAAGQQYKQRVPIPGFASCSLQELADAVVGILHNLHFLLVAPGVEVAGDDIGRVVADGEQGGHERLSCGGSAVEGLKGKAEEVAVAHAETVHHFAGRIILL